MRRLQIEVLLTGPAGRIGFEIGRQNEGAAGLTRPVRAVTEALQGPLDVAQDPVRPGQIEFITVFHHANGTASRPALRSVTA